MIVQRSLQHEAIASRRALLGGLASFASVLTLGGCAGVGATGARFDASSLSVDPTLLVATTRKRVNGGRAKPWFGPERASAVTVARRSMWYRAPASSSPLPAYRFEEVSWRATVDEDGHYSFAVPL